MREKRTEVKKRHEKHEDGEAITFILHLTKVFGNSLTFGTF